MDELVSIIIPAYNAECWISDTIRSALSQTWPKKEIIIVDDGSTDNTLTAAKRFESEIVKVVTQQNKGASAARNEGLRFAQGNYIQWLDADDLLAPDKISHQLKRINRGQDSRVLLTSSFGTFFFCHERADVSPTALWSDLSPVDWLFHKINENVWMNPAVWLVSRKLTEQAGPWNERLVRDNDGEYICRVVVASEKVQFVGEGMSYYRLGNIGSLSASTSDKARESMLLSNSLCIQYLLSLENSERTKTACLNLLQTFLSSFSPGEKELIAKINDLASELGGSLKPPRVNWKYYPVEMLLGREGRIKTVKNWRAVKYLMRRNWDKLLYQLIPTEATRSPRI
jgi:glycosyltransferase involved in cell wall biosynthesis